MGRATRYAHELAEGLQQAGIDNQTARSVYLHDQVQALRAPELDQTERRIKQAVILPFWTDAASVHKYFAEVIAPDLQTATDQQTFGQVILAIGSYADFVAHADTAAKRRAETRIKDIFDSTYTPEEAVPTVGGLYAGMLAQHPDLHV